MTVAELMKALARMPPEWTVFAEGYDQSCKEVIGLSTSDRSQLSDKTAIVLRTSRYHRPRDLYEAMISSEA